MMPNLTLNAGLLPLAKPVSGAVVRSRLGVLLAVMLSSTQLVGCSLTSSSGTQELLETRLRSKETEIASLEEQLQSTRWNLTASRQEIDALRASGVRTVAAGSPEQADQAFRVERIEIHALMSGGLDRDGSSGDEIFTVLVTPKDPSGKTLRINGQLSVQVFDFSRPEGDQEIGNWQLDRNQTSDIWHQGLIGSGFQFTSGWQRLPSQSELSVHARLVSVDGRQFDTTGALKIEPMKSNAVSATAPKPGTPEVFKKPVVAKAARDAERPAFSPNEPEVMPGDSVAGWTSTRFKKVTEPSPSSPPLLPE